ncbi:MULTISPECIES: 4a-hydroxytetrahydrobiopterin dehydratase [unclassified Achromobacter]|uniref:4a-hydroxytetrahydrobiopterin dehydratase n=1 Tax=unclassified Achromobacter TaxID=2626865 RepID=UPI000B51AB72|nr:MULTISPECIES: 4a-hydroxytetrahydrobiopterin dehydratase [unclassified Achromobacter]OWT77035.1 4a-hydroxytetrahydrobiopterin dehydratase [Achromobacter sp. HZ28]OWT77916.1 4a-hydroxytetrahydrobiopterin dehydratase [Achromobacter sp. HZ34]
MRPLLDAESVQAFIQQSPAWNFDKAPAGAIHRDYVFKDFRTAFGFMTQCALMAEKMDHHPDWSNSYNKVHVSLTTHDAGGVSQLDVDFARFADQVYDTLKR